MTVTVRRLHGGREGSLIRHPTKSRLANFYLFSLLPFVHGHIHIDSSGLAGELTDMLKQGSLVNRIN